VALRHPEVLRHTTGTAVSPEFGAVDSVGVDSANPSGIDLAGATTPPDSVVRGTSSVGTDVFNPSGIDQAGASITETVNPNYGTYSDTAGDSNSTTCFYCS
jgi:hypothetical protein